LRGVRRGEGKGFLGEGENFRGKRDCYEEEVGMVFIEKEGEDGRGNVRGY
jgi:hypothetical protein